jgi:pectate lyase
MSPTLQIPRRTLPALAGAAVAGTTLLAGTVAHAEDTDRLHGRSATARGRSLLDRIHAVGGSSADGPIWSPVATGFAGVPSDDLPDGTVGGGHGKVVVAGTSKQLAQHAAREEPTVILVPGRIEVDPFGAMIDVSSDTTIIGVGLGAEIVGGGLRLPEVSNVVIRNLTFRDSYIPGDWDGKSEDNDNDGVRIDTSDHVWIDHCEFTRLGDGAVDVRKDSTAVTLSWNYFHDHNKTVGVGWTDNLLTTLTMHHNWFSNVYQRNASIDNTKAAHLYNNLVEGIGLYGTMSRGAAEVVIEQSVYAHGEDAVVAKDPESKVDAKDNVFDDIRGRKDHTGDVFDPSDNYDYAADPVEDVEDLLTQSAGPLHGPRHVRRKLTVSLDGKGDYGSIGAALGEAWRADHPVEIVVGPGEYREIARIWEGTDHLTIRGTGKDPKDTVLVYDLADNQKSFYDEEYKSYRASTLYNRSHDVTLANLSVVCDYDEEANGGSQAQALTTQGDRVVLDRVRLIGNQDTFLAETPGKGEVARLYATGCYIEGDVDFIYGRGTVVIEDSEIHSYDRGAKDGETNGYVAAPSTEPDTHGILLTGCDFTSDARDGSVFLGRPWHPSSDPDVKPSVIVRDSHLGAHIGTPAWSDMGGFPWQDDLLREYRNDGPGAAPAGKEVDGRPQLSRHEAREYTRETYLSGSDRWRPWRR